MKTQLNLRKGTTKDGFRILKKFESISEARKHLQKFIDENSRYKPTAVPEVFYDFETDTQVWISRQFTPSGYRYNKPNHDIKI